MSSFDTGVSETHHPELHFEPWGPLPLSGLGCARGRCLAAWWAECLARRPLPGGQESVMEDTHVGEEMCFPRAVDGRTSRSGDEV